MTYSQNIGKALASVMQDDAKTILIGEGVTDPKGIFGTTLEAAGKFPERVLETPLSENMITGACLGLALEGWKPILVHARTDLVMTAMEHMVNTVAQWRHVHRDRPFNMVVRTIVGRGWGQGPNHSQALHAMFAHVPGLRVIYPVRPEGIGDWYRDALSCGWPTLIQEPRRMYAVESLDYLTWDRPDLHLITFGDIVLDAAQAALDLKELGIKAQVYPIEDVSAMTLPEDDIPAVVADTGHLFCGATAEVVARLAERGNSKIKRVGPPFTTLPTSLKLEQEWYPSVSDLVSSACGLLDVPVMAPGMAASIDDSFKGPF